MQRIGVGDIDYHLCLTFILLFSEKKNNDPISKFSHKIKLVDKKFKNLSWVSQKSRMFFLWGYLPIACEYKFIFKK